jgi:hypothetical protein
MAFKAWLAKNPACSSSALLLENYSLRAMNSTMYKMVRTLTWELNKTSAELHRVTVKYNKLEMFVKYTAMPQLNLYPDKLVATDELYQNQIVKNALNFNCM